ncbi:MAG: PPC domain-containing DNA-binding protein [Blastocatellia bacterium]
MKIKRTETGFLVVLDVGDEVMDSLKKLAAAERIGMASLTAIGAVRDVVLGYLDLSRKEYLKREFGADSMELIAMTGNLGLLNGEPVAHCHAVVGDREMRVYGGHLFEASASVTVEIFLRVYEGEITRRPDPDSGANLISA